MDPTTYVSCDRWNLFTRKIECADYESALFIRVEYEIARSVDARSLDARSLDTWNIHTHTPVHAQTLFVHGDYIMLNFLLTVGVIDTPLSFAYTTQCCVFIRKVLFFTFRQRQLLVDNIGDCADVWFCVAVTEKILPFWNWDWS